MPTLARAELTEPESPWGEPFDQMYNVLCRDRVPVLTARGFYAEHDLSRGPCSQEGKARSRMNALRHGLAAVSINTFTGTGDDNASSDDSCVDAMYQRLRQIEVERVKVLNDVHSFSKSQNLGKLHEAVGRLAALERYSQRAHSKLKKRIF